jgi:hypothetical protein
VRPSISRSDERPAWLCYIALNSGVVLVALHDPLALGEHALPRIASFRVLPRPSQDGEDE